MTHEEQNKLVREMMEEYRIPEMHARCYITNYFSLNRCELCRHTNDCTFIHACEREKDGA